MGKIPFFTKEQTIIFDQVANNQYFKEQFYFTGGTALSSFYLQHRYSDDLDFFSEKAFDKEIIFSFMEKLGKQYNFTIRSRFVEVVYIFDLLFEGSIPLKVDFSHYPHKRVREGENIEGFKIDSLQDIAINKVVTVSQRTTVKDFVDLYFLLQQFSLWDLIYGVKVKFRMEIYPLLLAADFLKVENFTFLPQMIKPLSLDELKTFYRQKAKELGKQAVE